MVIMLSYMVVIFPDFGCALVSESFIFMSRLLEVLCLVVAS